MLRGLKADIVIYNIGQLVTFMEGPLARVSEDNAVIVRDAGVAIRDGKIVAVGRSSDIKSRFEGSKINADKRLVTPGLIDPHTHLVFYGSREDEFEDKLRGVSYSEILARGGGIYRTVTATREANVNDLLKRVLSVARLMLSHGTTTIEVKSGYALDLEGEAKMLYVARKLEELLPLKVIPTLLAHVPPLVYKENIQEYVNYFTNAIIPEIANRKLALYIDVFCDKGAFSLNDSKIILEAGLRAGLRARIHADQIEYIGCSKLVEKLNLDSLDHLEKMPEENSRLIAERGAVATLLPTSIMSMLEQSRPPVRALREAKTIIAIGSDYNPNNMTPLQQTVIDISPYILGLTPLEALAAATINAAKSLNISHKVGAIKENYTADIIIWEIENYKWLGYTWGYNKVLKVIAKGRIAYSRE